MKKTFFVLFCVAILLTIQIPPQAAPSRALAMASQDEAAIDEVQLEPVLSDLIRPVYVTNARDGSNRLFVVEQTGRIKVLLPGETSPSVFLDITSKVLSAGNEQGLLGLAFHPQYQTNRRFFVNYTRRPDGATVVAEYQVSATDANIAEANETVLLTIAQPFSNHNGGMIEFGPDGYLYIATGDGGSANDPGNRAQNINELLGKILRINVDEPGGSQSYSSPSDNPFFGATPGRDEIFAYGLRNPWRFSFDRATGAIYAGDVGQNNSEEIDIIVRGGNYGWRVFEGNNCTNNDPALCGSLQQIAPVDTYNHGGGRCSVTGGYVYRGSKGTLPAGSYVFADFCTGEIFLFNNSTRQLLMDAPVNISSFGEDESGEIYVTGLGGTVHRLVNPAAQPPAPLVITNAVIRRRGTGELLDPVTVIANAKKYDLFVFEQGSAPNQSSVGATIFVNNTALNTRYTTTDTGTPVFVAKLQKKMLRQPLMLNIEVVRTDGTRSNQISIQVISSDQ